MKKTHILLAFILACLPFVKAGAEDYHYRWYVVDMQVHEDNSYSVTESWRVEFDSPRHGIVREFYTTESMKRLIIDGEGKRVEKLMEYSINIDNVDVSEQFEVDMEHGFDIRIGNPDKTVVGIHEYELQYVYHAGPDRTNADDLFYYNLLPAGTETEVDTFFFSVRFDKPVPQASLDVIKLLYDKQGKKLQAKGELTTLSDSLIEGYVIGLDAYQPVTIHMPLPEGYFTTSYSIVEASDNYWLFTSIALVLLAIVLIRETRSRNNFTPVVQCWPPKDISSAGIGYIFDTIVDPCDKASLIPYFAHKGLLTIDTKTGHPILHKLKDIDPKAPAYQRTLFKAFFTDSNVFDTEHPTKAFAKHWTAVDGKIEKAYSGMENIYSWFFICLYFVAGIIALIGLEASDITNTSTLLLYASIGSVGFVAIAFLSLFGWDTLLDSFTRKVLVGMWVVIVALQLWSLSWIEDNLEVYLHPDMLWGIGATYIAFLLGAIFMMRLGRMSEKRLKVIGHIVGLREFIDKSERPLLESLCKEHEQYFYDILPYAVAFGLADKWARQFEGLNVKPAEWYSGKTNSLDGLCGFLNERHLFSSAMSESVSHLEAARSRSQSSGGSSGGFSGGGFGGGGSHAW